MGFARFDMIHIQPHALFGPAPARHARLIAIFEQDLVSDLGPLVRLQELPAGWMRKVAGIGPPEPDALDEVEHSCILVCPRIVSTDVGDLRLLRTFETTLKIKRSGWQGNPMSKKLLYALTLDGLLQSAVPLGFRVSLTYRLVAPVSKTTSKPALPPELYHIFIRGGEPAAHGA
jgi:hypothetical protein